MTITRYIVQRTHDNGDNWIGYPCDNSVYASQEYATKVYADALRLKPHAEAIYRLIKRITITTEEVIHL